MKYLWFLFTFYLLAISVLPCSDTVECNAAVTTQISQLSTHEHHQHQAEQCPPFCSCACCGVQLFQWQPVGTVTPQKTVAFESREKASFYGFIYTKTITLAIWQPPKIS